MSDNIAREGAPILGATEEASEFANLLLQEFKPKTERAREAVETAVRTLAEQALAQTDLVSNDAIKSIESIIAAIDAKLTAQVNQIIHHQDFQQLESAWRGLQQAPTRQRLPGAHRLEPYPRDPRRQRTLRRHAPV